VFSRIDGIEIYFKHSAKDKLKISRVKRENATSLGTLGAGIRLQPVVPGPATVSAGAIFSFSDAFAM